MYITDPYGLPEIRQRLAALAEQFAGTPGLQPIDKFAQAFYDEHYALHKSPYTEGSSFAEIEVTVAERFLNQPALTATRHRAVNLHGDAQVQAVLAQSAADARTRWQATQVDGDSWGILGSIASAVANFASGNYVSAAVSAIRAVNASDTDAPSISVRASAPIVGRAAQLAAGTKVDPLGTFFRFAHG